MNFGPAFAVLLTVPACAAQTPRHEPVGTVTGHVMCADTQRPARLAQVKLVRVPVATDAKQGAKSEGFSDGAPVGNAVETSLDGSYVIKNVQPGVYYVVVDKAGYVLPLAAFSAKDLVAKDEPTRARIARTVHVITVYGEQTTNEDVVLARGASVSGQVSYDDGSPASNIAVKLLVKDADGKWVAMQRGRYRGMFGMFTETDDDGRYRISGLPEGEYATEADLELSDHETSFGPMPNNSNGMMQIDTVHTRFLLPLFSGDVLRKPEAKAYTLGSGEVRAGADLVFPIAKLHKVGGQVISRDGHALNGGKVRLLYADDNSEMTETSIQFDERAFQLEFVPEGEFVLKVTDAKDVAHVQVENAAGYTPRFREEDKTLRTYGDVQQALVVKGDMADVVVMVPAAK